MLRFRGALPVLICLLLTVPAVAEDKNYSIKTTNTPVPSEVKEPIRKLLSDKSVQFLDAGGNLLAELWFRKELPAKATPEQVKNGLTYRELEESTLIGAVRFEQQFIDYRKQKIKPGVYTLRIGFQPQDGDHMGTAPHSEFCLLVPAQIDSTPKPMEAKELRELSAKAPGGTHPGIMLLFPNDKPDPAPRLLDKGMGNLALSFKEDVVAGSQKTSLGFALTLVGHTTAE